MQCAGGKWANNIARAAMTSMKCMRGEMSGRRRSKDELKGAVVQFVSIRGLRYSGVGNEDTDRDYFNTCVISCARECD